MADLAGTCAACGRKQPALRPISDPVQRFWRWVNKTTGDGCWNWTGGRYRDGYGQFNVRRTRKYRAHRFAWEITHGPIPQGLYVCHTCDNRQCVRPDHLWLGTAKDNLSDASRKGRMPGNPKRRANG